MAMATEPPPTSTTNLHPQKALNHLLNTKCHYSLHNLKQIHAQSIKHGISTDNYIAGSLLKLYANPDLGSFHCALQVFDQVPKPHVFLWNSLIRRGFLDNGFPRKAIFAYCGMVVQGSRPNKYTFPSMFKACTAVKASEEGRQLHCHVVKLGLARDGHVQSSGIQMYAACGMVIEARRMFDEAAGVNASKNWKTSKVVIEARRMPDEAVGVNASKSWKTSKAVIEACHMFDESAGVNASKSWKTFEALHIGMIEVDKNKTDINTENWLDPISWNVMIDGYMRCGESEAAMELFDCMPSRNVGSWNAMISGYARIGLIKESRRLFDEMPQRDDVSWSALIDGYVGLGYFKDALEVFQQMQREGVSPKQFVLSSVLSACANAGALGQGRWIHEYIDRRSIELDAVLGTSLVDMYAKCGRIDLAFEVFKKMRRKETFSWNAMIGGFATHGHAKEAIELFLGSAKAIHFRPKLTETCSFSVETSEISQLWEGQNLVQNSKPKTETETETCLKLVTLAKTSKTFNFGRGQNLIRNLKPWIFSQMEREEFTPDAITFVGVLSACAHTGLVEEGYKFFKSMEKEYGISPAVEHYGCMVDLFGRAGLLEEAEDMIKHMPMKPNAAVWGALLGACRIHGNVKLGEKVGEILIELEPANSGRYALLSNIYAKAGRWDDVSRIRKLMKDHGVKTIPGKSLIESSDGLIHEFVMGDSSHPKMAEIRLMLAEILERLALEGYVANTSQVLFDIDEEEKESAVCYHSEKLAIAFGLISSLPGSSIRIVKNLRVCEDCHSATKLISRVYEREIVVRDRVRYHCFRDGKCSCKDFW